MQKNLMAAAAITLMMTAATALTARSNDDNPVGGEQKPVYKYLHYADSRDNMGAEERAQYAANCWSLERKDKLQQPKNWRTCQGELTPNEESELFPDPDYQPSAEGLRRAHHAVHDILRHDAQSQPPAQGHRLPPMPARRQLPALRRHRPRREPREGRALRREGLDDCPLLRLHSGQPRHRLPDPLGRVEAAVQRSITLFNNNLNQRDYAKDFPSDIYGHRSSGLHGLLGR